MRGTFEHTCFFLRILGLWLFCLATALYCHLGIVIDGQKKPLCSLWCCSMLYMQNTTCIMAHCPMLSSRQTLLLSWTSQQHGSLGDKKNDTADAAALAVVITNKEEHLSLWLISGTDEAAIYNVLPPRISRRCTRITSSSYLNNMVY